MGEIDIIGSDKGCIVFFEVKYRRDESLGFPEEAVDFRKQRTICKVCDYYRMIHKMNDFVPVRFDVIAIKNSDIKWYKNAFDYIP